jgi:cytochrome b
MHMHRQKVWDPFVRLFHWSLGLLVLGSFVTSEHDSLLPLHVRMGLGVVVLVVGRAVWGAVGPRHARFASFVRGPRAVLAYAREMIRGRAPLHAGHNPLGGAMVVAMLGLLVGIAATGALALAGPVARAGTISRHDAKEVHEALSGALVALVAVHVAGVIASSLLERQNLVLGMITGWKRAPEGGAATPARRHLRLVRGGAAAALAVVLAAGGLAILARTPIPALPRRIPVHAALAREHDDLREGARRWRSAARTARESRHTAGGSWDSGEGRAKIPH